MNSVPNMSFLSANDWLPASNPYSWQSAKNSRQIEQLVGEWGRVKMASVIEALLIRKEYQLKKGILIRFSYTQTVRILIP